MAYLRSTGFQTKMSALTLRRPVNADAAMASAIPKRTLIELPFPGQASLISALLDNFLSDVRIPGSSRYVLDLSGSMRGERIAGLKQSMLMLASGATIGTERYARFQNREEVGIITFSSDARPHRSVSHGLHAGTKRQGPSGDYAVHRPRYPPEGIRRSIPASSGRSSNWARSAAAKRKSDTIRWC